jgi:hypothetical protein
VSILGERTPLLADRLDSVAKLFSCVSLSPNGTSNSNSGVSRRWVEVKFSVITRL